MAEPTLTDESNQSRRSVRAADDTAAANALGLTFGSAERRGDVLVARIRPDEWLVIEGDDLVAGLDLSGFACAVDISHGHLQFRLTGTDAARALEKVCSLDFAEPMTPNLACAGASVAKVTCDLIRDDVKGVRSYLILCDTSYRDYLWDALVDAAAGLRDDAGVVRR